MQTTNNLSFTNQLPKWAIAFHIGLVIFFLLIGLGLMFLSVIEGIGEEFGLFLLGLSAVFLGLSWYAYNNIQKYLKFIVKIDLGGNGYDYYVKDQKKGEESHSFLSYEHMKYVLIGMDYQLMPESIRLVMNGQR